MSRLDDIQSVCQLGYSFGTLLGKGNYGKVFKAKYIGEKDEIIELACKYIVMKKCPDDFLNKFLPREMDILKKISHPFIVRTHSILKTNSSIFIFMRFCENGDLLEFVQKNGSLKEILARVWFFQITSAVYYLHSLNIAHRDLKLENILLSRNMNIKLADFGFARHATYNEQYFSNRKLIEFSETYCGSAAYAAPEVVSGIPYNIMKIDVWSLGIILSSILNGRMPFDDSNIPKLIYNQKNRLYNINPNKMKYLSSNCKLVIYKCLDPNPESRWSSSELLKTPWLQSQIEKYQNKLQFLDIYSKSTDV